MHRYFMPAVTSAIGPTQPTRAVQQVGSYLGYTGRGAGVVAKAAFDPLQSQTMQTEIIMA
jgi:hypothetical protein